MSFKTTISHIISWVFIMVIWTSWTPILSGLWVILLIIVSVSTVVTIIIISRLILLNPWSTSAQIMSRAFKSLLELFNFIFHHLIFSHHFCKILLHFSRIVLHFLHNWRKPIVPLKFFHRFCMCTINLSWRPKSLFVCISMCLKSHRY